MLRIQYSTLTMFRNLEHMAGQVFGTMRLYILLILRRCNNMVFIVGTASRRLCGKMCGAFVMVKL